ncbi:MAG: T9SS type A sorting domain-containing protein [Bacteroidota bacterium]
MLQRFFLAVSIITVLCWASSAQITLNSGNFPVAGLKVGRGYAIAPASVLGTTGGPQFFDFTGITPMYHDSVTYYNAASTPWASFHPGASVCNVEPVNNLVYVYYYTADANAFIKTGLTLIGDFGAGIDTVHGNYLPTDTILSTDYGYNHSETEYSSATILNLVPFADYKTCTNRNILVDGWGSLQTPLNYHGDVLRVKYAEYRYDTVFYLGSPLYIAADSLYYIKFFAKDVRHPVVTAHTDAAYNLQYFEFIFTPPVIIGCTDSMAQNYNPLANQSDGSCIYCNINYVITPDTTICPGIMITLYVSGGTSYLWSDSSTSSFISVSPDHTTVYSVYVSTSPDCHVLANVTVTVDEPVTAAFWTTHYTYTTGQEVQFVNLSENATYFQWDFDDPVNGTSTLEFPVHTYTTDGNKLVALTAGNSCFSDSVIDSLRIISSASAETVSLSEPFRIYPNPGNDVLFIEGSEVHAGTMSIHATDMMGRSSLLATETTVSGAFSVRVDIHQLHAGMYLLDIRSQDMSLKKKWIKM